LTLGVVKNIIPAIASTNALIAASCANECFKILSGASSIVDNYFMYIGHGQIMTSTSPINREEDCDVCNLKPINISISKNMKLDELIKNIL